MTLPPADWTSEDGRVHVYCGDTVEVMQALPDASVNCCVTSPPYFGLRDYGVDGQIGLEASPDAYVAKMVEVFGEVRRILQDDGVLFLNLGDSYAGGGGVAQPHRNSHGGMGMSNERTQGYATAGGGFARPNTIGFGLKSKDLIGIPWRVAFALQADGWYLRQDIIWHKPNPMPESVTDRCTKAHEYIFLLAKSERYYYDAEAVREPFADDRMGDPGRYESEYRIGSGRFDSNPTCKPSSMIGRNKRDVWTVATQPYSGAHFATFPPKLIEPCILAGCPKDGIVLDPFGGSGTTAEVAIKHGRQAIHIDLNRKYCDELAIPRLAEAAEHQAGGPLFKDAERGLYDE